MALTYGEPTADEAVLCTDAPEVLDRFDGGWSTPCEIDGDGEATGVKRGRSDC